MTGANNPATRLTQALNKRGITSFATMQDYKESPGPPVVEVMLSQEQAIKLAEILDAASS